MLMFFKSPTIILIVIIAVLTGVLIALPKQQPPAPAPGQTTAEPKGSMGLKMQTGQGVVKAGEKIEVLLAADTKEEAIVGYDAVIRFDPQHLSYGSYVSATPEFDIVVTEKEGEIIITGIKKLSNTNPLVLNQTSLVFLSFTSKIQAGETALTLVHELGATTDSNLVNTKAHDILATVSNLSLMVGQEITLIQKQPLTLAGLSMTLENTQVYGDECNDCIESADIIVSLDDQNAVLAFSQGGIDGRVDMKKELFGYVFEVIKIEEGRAVVRVGEE